MKICHASDWHGEWNQLPRADLYVFTGDMLPNFPLVSFRFQDKISVWRSNEYLITEFPHRKPRGHYVDRRIVAERERELQRKWCEKTSFGERAGFRAKFLNYSDAPVVIVPGNHDFISIAEFFGGDVWEVDEDPSRTIERLGLKIGGAPGIPYIEGEWNWETADATMRERMDSVPMDIDVLITHAPPNGIRDRVYNERVGSQAIRAWIEKRSYQAKPLRAHFFGHVHEQTGCEIHEGTLFSNAARKHVTYEL